MSLNWNLGDIADYESVCWTEDDDGERVLNPVTNALIWITIAVGIGEITPKTEDEFYARVHFVETTVGHYLRDAETGEPRPITPEDVHAHLGLTTNVFPMKTRAQWLKTFVGHDLDDYKGSYRRAIESVSVS